jgi:hypothetical protein
MRRDTVEGSALHLATGQIVAPDAGCLRRVAAWLTRLDVVRIPHRVPRPTRLFLADAIVDYVPPGAVLSTTDDFDGVTAQLHG